MNSERVLDAAAKRFSEQGYRGTNLDDVVSGMGVTRQALYYYYKSKYDILVELFKRLWDQIDHALEEATAGETEPALKFEAMVQGHLKVIASQPELAAILAREDVSLEGEAADLLLKRRRSYQKHLEEAYAEGVAAGVLRDVPPTVAVSLILGAINWTFRWYQSTGPLDVEQLAGLTMTLLRDGYMEHPR